MSVTTRVRRARKAHWCDTCAHRCITPGQQYLEGTAFPGHDVITVDHPVRLRECRECAEQYGRDGRFTTENGDTDG